MAVIFVVPQHYMASKARRPGLEIKSLLYKTPCNYATAASTSFVSDCLHASRTATISNRTAINQAAAAALLLNNAQ